MTSRIDLIGQNGNTGEHYDFEILEQAKKIINGERQEQYGKAENNFKTISIFWSEYLKHEITSKDVAMLMVLLKVARMSAAGSQDTLVDICGYAALCDKV